MRVAGPKTATLAVYSSNAECVRKPTTAVKNASTTIYRSIKNVSTTACRSCGRVPREPRGFGPHCLAKEEGGRKRKRDSGC